MFWRSANEPILLYSQFGIRVLSKYLYAQYLRYRSYDQLHIIYGVYAFVITN